MDVSYDERYDQFAIRQVFSIRIAVHSLGQQYENDNSENHVTINLLLGGGLSARLDMQTGNEENLGQLFVQGRVQTESESMITFLDLKACGCPVNFNPLASPPQQATPTRSVQEFVNLITNGQRHWFRFLLVDGHSDGCRYWA